MTAEFLNYLLSVLGSPSQELLLGYLPIPFFLTALYTFLVFTATTPLAYRIRMKVLRFILWFNVFGLPGIFLLGTLLFQDLLIPTSSGDSLSLIFQNIQLGMVYGGVSASPVLALALRKPSSDPYQTPN